MSDPQSTTVRFPVAVIMERTTLQSRWASERWEAKGLVSDDGPRETRVIVDREDVRQVLYPGYAVTLQRHEAEGYYLNLTSPQPKIFVLWRMREDGTPRPEMLTASYNEGTRWADSGEQVDGVSLPTELVAPIAEFVERHYAPEPPKRKRYASNRDKGRMGRVEG